MLDFWLKQQTYPVLFPYKVNHLLCFVNIQGIDNYTNLFMKLANFWSWQF